MNEFILGYTNYLKRLIKNQEPLLVVCDTSNGSLGPILQRFNDAKLHLVILNEKPDGNFPGHGPNPLEAKALEELSAEVKRSRADFGIAFDSDGDRVVLVDDEGEQVPVDEAAFLLSERFSEPYILDVRVGQIFEGKKIVRSKVGHYFIKNLMQKKKAEFGAEISGHYYFKFDFEDGPAYFDSGLRAFAEFVNLAGELKSQGVSFSNRLVLLPQFFRSGEIDFRNVSPADMKKIEKMYKRRGGRIDKTDGLLVSFPEDGWWFNIRNSNTEDTARLNLESKDNKIFQEEFFALKTYIESLYKK